MGEVAEVFGLAVAWVTLSAGVRGCHPTLGVGAPGAVCRAFLHPPVHSLLSSGQWDWDRTCFFNFAKPELNRDCLTATNLLEKNLPPPSNFRGIYLQQDHED